MCACVYVLCVCASECLCMHAMYVTQWEVHMSPFPPYNENTTARIQLRALLPGVFHSSARSRFCGTGIPPCKILISPRPLTTPRFVFAIKPEQGARSCCCLSPHANGESARELRARFSLLQMAHSARSSPRVGFEYCFSRLDLCLRVLG